MLVRVREEEGDGKAGRQRALVERSSALILLDYNVVFGGRLESEIILTTSNLTQQLQESSHKQIR